ncbi:MAG TPA: aminopeptidase P family protein [Stellaceae bacterium]|nr:aminopeptidase P family protein [Stellaceae bacterium]
MRNTLGQTGYRGDAVLGELLAEAGSPYDPVAVRALILGVLAAPPARDPVAWMVLVAAEPSPSLAVQLDALKAELAVTKPGAVDRHARLAALRGELDRQGFDGFIIGRADVHQGEYIPANAERLSWVTGFTGSAGLAVVLRRQAALFVDGRYTVQAVAEVDAGDYLQRHITTEPATDWIAETLRPGEVLGYDPWLLTPATVDRFRAAAEKAGGELRAVAANPVDAIWPERPPAPISPARPHDLDYAGKSAADKRAEIGAALARDKIDAAVITAPDSLAWLLNIRGGDVPHTPLALGFATVAADGSVDLFIDRRKLVPGLDAYLGNGVAVRPMSDLGPAIDALAGKRVRIDPAASAAWLVDRLTAAGAEVQAGADPCRLPKAVKNPVELDGARRAHRRDAVAVTRFLAWFDGASPSGELTELDVAAKLEACRAGGALFRDLSFTTISAAGPNAALPHYRATAETEGTLLPDSLYLVDSGAQYLDGTTDITRTIAIGTPTPEMKDRYTRVLKGHIALGTAIFPKGTTGAALDVLARLPLWQAGLNFDHGTGHGVGSYLSVHEGPQRIAQFADTQALIPGMIISNEPGYYKPGAFGIRIENLIVVTELGALEGGDRDMLGFETITLAPIDKTPIEPSLLTRDEIAWLDAYHARVRASLAPLIEEPDVAAWLERATAPLLG